MKSIVVYKSKYGFTKTYAEWIAKDLGADLMISDNVKEGSLSNYDTIIFGGGLYAGGVSGIKKLIQNYDSIQNKAIYLFTVGASDMTDQTNIEGIRGALNNVLPPPMLEKIKLYHLRGGMKYSKMTFVHRVMMSMFLKMLSKKPENELGADAKAMIEAQGQDVDFTDFQQLVPMLQDIKGIK